MVWLASAIPIVSSIQMEPTPTDRFEISAAFIFVFFLIFMGPVA